MRAVAKLEARVAVVERDLQERHAFVVADDMVRRASLGEGRGDTVRRRSRNGGPATRAAPADEVEGTLRELRASSSAPPCRRREHAPARGATRRARRTRRGRVTANTKRQPDVVRSGARSESRNRASRIVASGATSRTIATCERIMTYSGRTAALANVTPRRTSDPCVARSLVAGRSGWTRVASADDERGEGVQQGELAGSA